MVKNYRFSLLTAGFVLLCSSVQAEDLSADPWTQPNPTENVVKVQQVGPVIYGAQPYQPTYEGGASNVWNTKMPEFTGEMTTWNDGQGQKVNAPEVNMHNILSITEHLRRMGYKIPTSFEEKVKAAPEAVRVRIKQAMSDMASASDPFSKSAQFARKTLEQETGMTFENVIGNSLDLLSSK